MTFEMRSFTLQDYDEVRVLWESTDGLGLSSADSREGVASFIARNPNLSLVGVSGGQIVGALLVGHDGRRGYLHHLAVSIALRGKGFGRQLVHEGLYRLAQAGIQKCHLFVFEGNESGRGFWSAVGADERRDLKLYSISDLKLASHPATNAWRVR